MAPDPARLLASPDAFADPGGLAVVPARRSSVFQPADGERAFNLHSYVCRFDGQFWAAWSSGLRDEEGPGQRVAYATSPDGRHWSAPGVLAAPPPAPAPQGGLATCICRGIFPVGDRLFAYAAILDRLEPGVGWKQLRLHRYEWDGDRWRDRGLLLDDALNNFPPRAIGGRLLMTIRVGNRDTFFTALSRDAAGDEWDLWRFPHPEHMSESTWYVDPQGVVHLLSRDHQRGGYLWHTVSKDDGATWATPVQTDYPDATSKCFSLRLSSGVYVLINNPDQRRRDPLAVSFSRDGWRFGEPRALVSGPPPLRTAGRAKRSGSVQYPHAMEHDGALWVIYSVNKEDIQIAEYQLDDLVPGHLEVSDE